MHAKAQATSEIKAFPREERHIQIYLRLSTYTQLVLDAGMGPGRYSALTPKMHKHTERAKVTSRV